MDASTPTIFILLFILKILSTSCRPEAEYQIFRGFDMDDWSDFPAEATTPKVTTTTTATTTSTSTTTHGATINNSLNETSMEVAGHTSYRYLKPQDLNGYTKSALPNPMRNYDCPEDETPSNIGPYEVPTQRDLVLLTMKTLHRMFASYHQTAMTFLDDVQKVVTATDEVALQCRGNRVAYKKCVRQVTVKCEAITMSLTSTLEKQRQDILAFGQDTICNLEAMKADPVKLIKILASEEASLKFALPGFLRLLNKCNPYCLSHTSAIKAKAIKIKPSRRLSNSDVIIRHFLTKKNYKRLLKPGSEIFETPISNRNIRKP